VSPIDPSLALREGEPAGDNSEYFVFSRLPSARKWWMPRVNVMQPVPGLYPRTHVVANDLQVLILSEHRLTGLQE